MTTLTRQAGLWLCAALLPLASLAFGAERPKTACQLAVPCNRPAGAPKASDVIMRTLRFHPAGKKDAHDTLRAVRQFHVTRLEWAYVDNREQIERIKTAGCLFGGAASAPSYYRQKKEPGWFEKVVIVNRLGEPIIAPWKRTWNRTLWGCINNPELERGYVAYLKRYVDAGVQVMQRDEPGANFLATRWGGCFCPHCMQGFRKYLAEKTTPQQRAELGIADLEGFDYAKHLAKQNAPAGDAFGRWKGGRLKELFVDFQTQATIAFHRRTRKALDAYAGRHVAVSCNNGVHRWGPIELEFDWAFGELSYGRARPGVLYEALGEAARHGRIQVVTMPKKSNYDNPDQWQRRTRRSIATAYACGALCMVPWDVYMPGDAPRYFGTPQQYADLFGFIRAAARYLDGYEQAAAVGKEIRPEKGDKSNLCEAPSGPLRGKLDLSPFSGRGAIAAIEGGSGEVLAVVRAKPGEPEAPVVVHLVDWGAEPKPLTLKLRSAGLFGARSVVAELFMPAPYEKRAHETAAQTRDYAALARSVKLPVAVEGDWTVAKIPALGPWGIVVVRPR